MQRPSTRRLVSIGLCAAAALLLVLVQFLPWGGISASFGSATAEADAYTWKADFQASGFGQSQSDSKGWYESDFDDQNGTAQVRAAAPLATVGLAGSLAAGALLFLLPRRWGTWTALGAMAVTIVAIVLMTNGIKDLFDDQQDWGVSLWLAIAATVLLAAAAVVDLLPRPAAKPGA